MLKMTETSPISGWKKLAIRNFFGGVSIAVTIAIILGLLIWYNTERPKPWNNVAFQAQWDTMEFKTGSSKVDEGYPVEFHYNLRNNTDKNYPFNSSTMTVMAVLKPSNALSEEFGHYQLGEATVDGPKFIPPKGTARIVVHVSYYYPSEFTNADKNDVQKIIANFNRRLNELNGFVLFDEQNHYRIDLPKGWKDNL
jgi:hypothetical protein